MYHKYSINSLLTIQCYTQVQEHSYAGAYIWTHHIKQIAQH